MNEPLELTRSQLQQIMAEAEAFEATCTEYEIAAEQISVAPDGRVHVYTENTTFASLAEALDAIRGCAIYIYKNGLKVYTDIVAKYPSQRPYNEYFTKERIEYFRELIQNYPKWIALVEQGKLPAYCDSCDRKDWFIDTAGLDLENPPECECGGHADFSVQDED